MNTEILDFLKKHSIDASSVNTANLLDAFAADMTAGLAGKPSSLKMIPSYLGIDKAVPVGKPVIVIDAGGTNLRVCVVTFGADGKPEISHFTKHHMPGTDAEEVSADKFFSLLADYVKPLLPYAENIGFCFSYAAEITPDCDGRLLHWTKQVKAPEVVGKMVGSELAKRLAPFGFKGRIIVLNDTVAALLAGVSSSVARRYDGYVGFILGTGTNIATVVDNSEITKVPGLAAGKMIINVESGAFDKVPVTDIDQRLDATTMDAGTYGFEKKISGGYLGRLGLAALKTAAEEGLFSKAAAAAVLAFDTLDNKDLDDFCDNPLIKTGPFAALDLTDDDRRAIQAIAGAVYKRAAVLSAINLATAILRSGGGHDPLAPVCVNVDGSTFYRTLSVEFKSRIEAKLRDILEPYGISYKLVCIPDAPVVGAAVAGLTF